MRIRTVKPEFFTHEGLYELEASSKLPVRVAFAGLWCAADREGRFKWEPRRLGVAILPYDGLDFSRVLDALTTRGFVVKYRVNDAWFGYIPSFSRHQVINNREKASDLPEVALADESDATATREPRVDHACKAEGKGREGNGKEGVGVKESRPAVLTDAQKLAELADDLAYRHINIPIEHAKMVRWCEANRKQPTHKRFINWLNRIEQPFAATAPSPPRPLGVYDAPSGI